MKPTTASFFWKSITIMTFALGMAACVPAEENANGDGDGNDTGGEANVTLQSIAVNPSTASIEAGQNQQFTATASYDDGSSKDVTSSASWTSSDANIVTVDGNGVATGVAGGSATITVSYEGKQGSASVTVAAAAATLESIEVMPTNPTIAAGTSEQFTATGHYDDSTTKDITGDVTWSSSDMGVAAINAGGSTDGVAPGTATVTAELDGVSGSTQLTVTAAALESIEVTPVNPEIAVGTEQQFAATGRFSDGSTQDLSGEVSWSSSAPNIASISSGGLATGADEGTTTIIAELDGVAGDTVLSVSGAALEEIEVTPTNPSIANGTTQQFTATGHFSDGSTQDITPEVTWSSSAENIATIDNGAGDEGVATAVGEGVTEISAALDGVSGATELTVTEAVLMSIEVTPIDPSIPLGLTEQFTATGIYSDASSQNITADATWTSSEEGVATISNANGSVGLATSVSVGTTVVTATLDSVAGDTELAVTAAELTSILVEPREDSIALGLEQQFTLTGIFTDLSEEMLTEDATWTSSNTDVVFISNEGGNKGLATTLTTGAVTITASYGGMEDSTLFTVTDAELVTIEVLPPDPSVPLGNWVNFIANGHYTNESIENITADVTWDSSDDGIATVSNAQNKGRATSVTKGSVTITATLGDVDGSTSLEVIDEILVSITVEPPMTTVALGLTQQYTAWGHYTDSSSVDITDQVLWETADPFFAVVSNAMDDKGLAFTRQPSSPDFFEIRAIHPHPIPGEPNIIGTAELRVNPPLLYSLEITPVDPFISAGMELQFEAIGHFSDGTRNITGDVDWFSSLTGIADIGNVGELKGRALTHTAGATTITAEALIGPEPRPDATTTLTVSDATLNFIEIVPTNPHVSAGFDVQFEAWGHYSDLSVLDITDQVTWDSDDEAVATIDTAGLAETVAAGTSTITAELDGTSETTTINVSSATLELIEVTPQGEEIAAGTQVQFTAMGHYSDATTVDLTEEATWESSQSSIASVSNTAGDEGVATGVSQGLVTITATYDPGTGNVSGDAVLTVSLATLTAIEVVPDLPSIALGLEVPFHAIGHYSDTTMHDITGQVTWASSEETVAIISNAPGEKGRATSEGAGTTTITASFEGVEGDTELTVTSATLEHIVIEPPGPSIALGTEIQLSATGVYSDDSTQDITDQATWSSSDTAIATVSNADGSEGLVAGVDNGLVTITAALDDEEGTTPVTVTEATITEIEVAPLVPEIAAGNIVEFSAIAHFTDGSSQEITHIVSWTSTDGDVAVVSNAPGNKGVATGIAAGTAMITAALDDKEATTEITVTSATLDFIEVHPMNPEIAAGTKAHFQAFGHYTDHSVQNITEQVTWESSDEAVATISNSEEEAGVATGVAAGAAVITATLDEVSADTGIEVTSALLQLIEVTPPTASIAKGTEEQFTAIGHYSDDTTQDITAQVSWSSSNVDAAVVSNGGDNKGLATSVNQGSTTITAAIGETTGNAVLTVTAATLVSIEVAPVDSSVALGSKEHFHAIGHFSDTSTHDITGQVTWTSSDEAVATISNASDEKGLADSVAAGTTTITASFVQGEETITGTASFEVTSATLEWIEVTPILPSIPAGTTIQFQAFGHYSDDTSQEITTEVTWSSTSTSVAEVSNAEGDEGVAEAVALGTTTIQATLDETTGQTDLHVSSATLVSIEVEPQEESIALGTAIWFEAWGHYSDGSSKEITMQVSWSSSDGAVAAVSNAPDHKGFANTVSAGTVTVTAAFDELSGTASLEVTAATLTDLEIMPHFLTVPAGAIVEYQAVGFYSDGTHQDLTTQVTWSTSDETAVTISNLEGDEGIAEAVAEGSATITADYDESTSATATLDVSAALLESIEVAPQYESIASGTTIWFEAWGHYSDNSTQEITGLVVWDSSATGVAQISNGEETKGLATGVAQGTTTITASFEGVDGDTVLTVTAATLQMIEIHPVDPEVAAGTRMQLHAIGHFSDATTREITGQVTWSSDDATIATVSNADDEKGLANAVGENQSDDTATITAMFDTVSGTTELTVTDALLEAIELAPYNPEIAKGQEQQFTAIGHYSDDSTQEITEQVTWTSSNPSVAVISNQDELSGLANGGAQGTSTISAALDEITSSTILTVTTATLTSIEVLPPDAVVAAGTKVHFQAIGHFSDYTAHDITGLVSWESDDETAAIISNADGEKGMATGIALGTATITAAFEEVSGTADLEVTAALLQHIEVTPYSPSIPDGTKIEFTATGYYSDDTVQNITDQVQWTSSDTDVAVISNVDEEKGVAEGVDSGTTTIKAALGDEEATTVLTVTAATLTSIEVLPPDPDIAAGTKIQLHAIGHFSNSTVADLTPHVAWTSSDSAVAVISNAAGEHGQATAVAEGSATITAAFDEVSGTVSMTVSAALLDFIEVHPVSPSIPAGYEIQMVAIGHYSDHSVQEITDQVAWSSSDPTTAVASNADDAKGLTSALSAGTATITARFDSTTASTTITVTLATLDSIEVLPAETAIANGTHAWFDAIGHYSDSTARQITSEVSWSTSDETVALISNADGEKGFASSVAAGTTTITATHAASEVSGDATLVVTAATVTNIEVTPHHPSIANGTPAQFRAYAHFTDDTHQEVTGRAVWNTSNSAVAVVSNADDDRGLARAVGTGSATISASFGGQTGDTVLTVTAALLTRIEVTPFTPSIALGTHAWFNAIGHYSDNTVHDITHMVTWTSSSTSVAVISNAEEEKGLASSVALGTTTITASLDEDSGSTTLTVTNPTVTALEVTPHYPSIADGTSIQFNAYAHFSNGTHQDVTTRAAWSSDDGTVAVVSNVSGDEGVATGVAAGDATISAAFGGTTGSTDLEVTLATLQSIEVHARTFTIADGTGVQFHAIGAFSDDTVHEITHLVTWSSDDTTVATVSNGADDLGWVQSVDPGTATISAAFDGVTGSADLTVTTATLSFVEVVPHNITTGIGIELRFNAFAHYSDGTHLDVTPRAAWGSSDTAVAEVSNSWGSIGVVTTIGAGSATITATFNGTSGTTTITVTSAEIEYIEVAPQYMNIAVDTEAHFRALAHFTDYRIRDITEFVRWSSSDTAVAVISNHHEDMGRTDGLSAGTSTISATYIDASGTAVTGTTTLTVSSATLSSIAITPSSETVPVNLTLQMWAIGTFSDSTTQDLTPYVTWGSSATTYASVSNSDDEHGLLRTYSAGDTTITATYDGVSGVSSITVSAETLSSITVTPDSPTVPNGYSVQMTATANFSGGTSLDVTDIASWISSATSVAEVSNGWVRHGRARARAGTGTATISAYFGGTSGSTTLTASDVTLSSIAVTPDEDTIDAGDTLQYTATGTFSDVSTLDITKDVAWRSSDETAAEVSNFYFDIGLATGVAAGSATISATDPRSSTSGSTSLTVQ